MTWRNEQDAIKTSYDSDGFVAIRSFLNKADTERLSEQLERYVRDVVPQVPPMDAFFDNAAEKTGLRMLPRMDHHDPFFAEMLNEGPVRDLATLLCGTEVLPRDAAFFNKLPFVGDATPPHQDGYYFHLKPCEALTLWLSLDEVDESNGCLRYVRGSHLDGMRSHGRTEVLGFSQGIIDYGTPTDQREEEAVCAQPGDLLAHHALTIHRADANRSNRSRRAFGFVYFSADARVDREASAAYQQELSTDLASKGKI